MISATGLLRAQVAVSAVWLGLLLSVAGLATPAAFAVLTVSEAGAYASAVLSREARWSLFLAVVMLLLDRARARQAVERPWGPALMGTLVALAATVLGHFVLGPHLALVKADPSVSALSFGQWHAVSVGLFGVKIVAVGWTSWQLLKRFSP